MICEEFKRAYSSSLDGVLGEGEARHMLAHAQQCQGCAAYRDALASLDADLRHLPALEIPARLVQNLEQLPQSFKPREARVGWRPEFFRILPYGVAAIVASLLLGELPAQLQAVGNSLLAFAGTLVFFLAVLWPIFHSERIGRPQRLTGR